MEAPAFPLPRRVVLIEGGASGFRLGRPHRPIFAAVNISGAIVTLNEEANIARAVRSLRFCDEVVIVDCGSTDRTCQAAAALGARVIASEWRGYAQQKNFCARSAANDWILSIDADEQVSAELAREIEVVRRKGTQHDGFDFPRLARYRGVWIRHSGWYPDRKVRLYRRAAARWVGDYVHESVQVEGSVGRLDGDLLHYTCNSAAEHLQTIERYTDLAARELHDSGGRAPRHRLIAAPTAAFLRSFLWKLGFLDGAAGFAIARMAALYAYKKYAKARRLAAEQTER